MDNKKLNETIALHLNYTFKDEYWNQMGEEGIIRRWFLYNKHGLVREGYPNWAEDLNAMANLERTLWHDECLVEQYRLNIESIYTQEVGYSGAGYWFMAPAYIRAAAYLKTVQKEKS